MAYTAEHEPELHDQEGWTAEGYSTEDYDYNSNNIQDTRPNEWYTPNQDLTASNYDTDANMEGHKDNAIEQPYGQVIYQDPSCNPSIATQFPVPRNVPRDKRSMIKLAKSTSQLDRLGQGKKSFSKITLEDIGDFGIGLQLYFMLTKYLSITFFIMGLLALPSMVLHLNGNGIDEKLADPLGLAYFSLGNEGVYESLAQNTQLCAPNTQLDCNWTTIDTPFTSDPEMASWIIVYSDCAHSLVFLIFCAFYVLKAREAIERYENENLSPAKYAIYVKGLPRDATEKEIIDHFNVLYELSSYPSSRKLWFSCCWGRRKVSTKMHPDAGSNISMVTNVEHLEGSSHPNPEWYLNTWIAEVSISHPTGGLLRTFLSMGSLNKKIDSTRELIKHLNAEKSSKLSTSQAWSKADERTLEYATKKLAKLQSKIDRVVSKLKAFQMAKRKHGKKKGSVEKDSSNASKVAHTPYDIDLEACDCAFVVFNNLESRRRCLHDYRKCMSWLPHYFQPEELRFRGIHRLQIRTAPEPSNIIWENLEITERGRLYRRSLTNFLTFMFLMICAVIISGAQTAQKNFKAKMPPAGLCKSKLPAIFYGNDTFNDPSPGSNESLEWHLVWDKSKNCTIDEETGNNRFYIHYTNNFIGNLPYTHTFEEEEGSDSLNRCTEPCISELSSRVCSTLPCFVGESAEQGQYCEKYLESHLLYCLCVEEFTLAVANDGISNGPKKLWDEMIPCRGFIRDYVTKNAFIMLSSCVVLFVNILLKSILLVFVQFERHSSESGKTSAIAFKLFAAQFLNTGIIVLLTNFSLGLDEVPIAKELFRGKYNDFEREWYAVVGMGITMTMLINVFVPQIALMFQLLFSPLIRFMKLRFVVTQKQMNDLYAGQSFDIALRYPLILNSLFVTMAFSGGSPILLFIGALSLWLMYAFDKLSIMRLYSIKTTYDEELGLRTMTLLPWTLVLHLFAAAWMFGNPELMQSKDVNIQGLLDLIGLEQITIAVDADNYFHKFLEYASSLDFSEQYGWVPKVARSQVMIMVIFAICVTLSILAAEFWTRVLGPFYERTIEKIISFLFDIVVKIMNIISIVIKCLFCCGCICCRKKKHKVTKVLSGSQEVEDEREGSECSDNSSLQHRGRSSISIHREDQTYWVPEFTDYFRKSVPLDFKPDTELGFKKIEDGTILIREWREETATSGFLRVSGEQRRTWEAFQAPIVSYAIDANPKYKSAVEQLYAAYNKRKEILKNIALEDTKKPDIENKIQATDDIKHQDN